MKRTVIYGTVLAAFLWFLIFPMLSLLQYREGEGGAICTFYFTGDGQTADQAFNSMREALQVEGFRQCRRPDGTESCSPSNVEINGESAFYGSYRNSYPFYITVVRDGPKRSYFHLYYEWNQRHYSSSFKIMHAVTDSFTEFMKKWALDHGAHLPPEPPKRQ